MFEKFTEGAIKVIMLSQEEARRMGSCGAGQRAGPGRLDSITGAYRR